MNKHSFISLSSSFIHHAEFSRQSNSPFDAIILQKTGELILEDNSSALSIQLMFTPWIDLNEVQLTNTAVAARWISAWHSIALKGVDNDLSATFPSPATNWQGDADLFWNIMLTKLSIHRADILLFMQHEPQTNEVNRCILLLPGFLYLAHKYSGKDFQCFELGASAGLVSLWPYYQYSLSNDNSVRWGDENSLVKLSTEWKGKSISSSLISAQIPHVSVKSCDKSPVNIKDAFQILRLRSYIWSDQRERMERLDAAIQMSQQSNIEVEAAEAVEWIQSNLKLTEGKISILYHTYVWQYIPDNSREKIIAHINNLGSNATSNSPLAWLTVESETDRGYVNGSVVKVKTWPGGEEIIIAECQPHGKWIEMKI